MSNMIVENECKDARDLSESQRVGQNSSHSNKNTIPQEVVDDIEVLQVASLQLSFEAIAALESVPSTTKKDENVKTTDAVPYSPPTPATAHNLMTICQQAQLMKDIKKCKRPRPTEDCQTLQSAKHARTDVGPHTSLNTVALDQLSGVGPMSFLSSHPRTPISILH
ncbi:hypothetical protein SERLA73DRAFT_68067 [Serpula lacrymans var. lacrymans S7.3]|uniref:Uncharacterized protein n=2 Tax=Serpula lacrymans var. lacrymans TaxID=341189 RepID=F8PGN4_SERL3|nr:uncharacterized protein SERLADRAFT_431788 [Serpula lacrymans var. lacrymans S7.9]EGO04378.1 hypothetical protein SERLA73DRAFT_68067 [Serpula lacrymans var. lacrymans S7.3]EGO30284.1 hypothetical protein SERLADRAFT_431788 [Serpula lacrymans var. lacrymans S7.9]